MEASQTNSLTNYMKIPIVLAFLAFSFNLQCQEIKIAEDSTKKNQLFEFSFGQSLLFISNSKSIDIHNNQAVVVPTSSILFFVEMRPQKRFRIPIFLNLPIETKQFLVNNILVNERASPTFGTGIEFKCFQINLGEKSKIDFEIGPLASFLLNTNNVIRLVPVLAGRFRIMRGENFVMYIGGTYSIGINTWGLLYGTGTIF